MCSSVNYFPMTADRSSLTKAELVKKRLNKVKSKKTKYCFVDHLFPRFLTKDIVRDLNHTANYLYIVTFHAWISSTQKAITLSSLQEEDRSNCFFF